MNSPASDAEDIGNGMRRKILGYDNNLMLVKVWFEKGAVGPVHAHPHTQTAYVVEGKFE
ncbi:MAG TPA: cupin domain-containing protein, partial [Hyphomonas sp.]|nr:cupin domain-containing protein [Hyphomonas sp.]